MISKFLAAVLLSSLASVLSAQSVVTATVQSASGGQPYASGNYQVSLVDASGNPLSVFGYQSQFIGTLSSAGSLSLPLFPNSQIQAGSQWQFHVCSAVPKTLNTPQPSPVASCFSLPVTIQGAGDISSILAAAAPAFYACTQWSGTAWQGCGTGSGGSGNISGTVSATHLTMGTGADTVGDSPATYASNLFTFPDALTVQAHSAFGVGALVDDPSVNGPSILTIEETSTLASGEQGISLAVTLNPSTDNTSTANFGFISVMQSASGNIHNFNDLIGIYGAGYHQGSGIVPQITGVDADTENLGGGNVAPPGETGGMYGVANFMDNFSGHVYGPSTNASAGGMVGYQTDMKNEGTVDDAYLLKGVIFSNSGTITNLYGVYAGFTNPTNSGTLHNEYGVYIPLVALGDTLNYQLYSAGTAPTYFHSSTFQLDNITGHGTAGVVAIDVSGNLSNSAAPTISAANMTSFPASLARATVSNPITSATGGSGTGTVACATASCTNLRGSYTVAGGTFATGTLLTLVWPTTTTAYACNGSVLNNATGASIGYHSVATATGMTFSALTAATGLNVDIDYACQP